MLTQGYMIAPQGSSGAMPPFEHLTSPTLHASVHAVRRIVLRSGRLPRPSFLSVTSDALLVGHIPLIVVTEPTCFSCPVSRPTLLPGLIPADNLLARIRRSAQRCGSSGRHAEAALRAPSVLRNVRHPIRVDDLSHIRLWPAQLL